MAVMAMAVGSLAAAGPASGADSQPATATAKAVRGIPTITTQTAKVKGGSQKVHSANIGQNFHSWPECKPGASTMEKVVWNLGKVTRSSARVKSVKVRYYNERELHVGSAYVHDGNHRTQWLKANGWYIPKGPEEWRTYKINKTVKFSKSKPLNFMLKVQMATANEPAWCHARTDLTFQLKPNR
ncbi:hypothetical protein [Streptomyces formicae]